jgi:hypothetical protein
MSVKPAWTRTNCALWKKNLKFSSDSDNSGSKKCKQGYGEDWWGLHLAGVFGLESDVQFSVGVFCMNLASVTKNIFSHLIYFIKIFYKFCNFNVIFKDGAAIRCCNKLC